MADYKVLIGANTTQLVTDIETVTSKKTYDVKVQADGTSLSTLSKQIDTVSTTFEDGTKSTTTFTNSVKDGTLQLDKMSTSTTNATSTIKKATTANKSFASSFVDNTKKVFQFGLSTAVIGAMYSVVNMATEAVFEFNSTLTEFNKVSEYSIKQTKEYSSELAELGLTVARTGTEMLESASNAVKAGYSEEEAKQLAVVSSLYQNVADSAIESGDAMTFVVSQLKAFDISVEDSTQVVDKLNAVANTMSVSNTDLATGLSKNASSISSYGNSIDETIALKLLGLLKQL